MKSNVSTGINISPGKNGIGFLLIEPIVFPSDKKINDAKNLKQLNDFRKSKRKEVIVCYLENNKYEYAQGTITIIPAGSSHKVVAGEDGLYILAKFTPALL